jgi:hypothetical protein
MKINLRHTAGWSHISRLYEQRWPDLYVHVDKPNAVVEVHHRTTRHLLVLDMTPEAVEELLADAEYLGDESLVRSVRIQLRHAGV